MEKTKEKLALSTEKRSVFGKKLKKMRHENILPANIYGTDFKSLAVSTKFKDFIKVYKTAKETGVIYLSIDNKEIPVLIKNIQLHPVSHLILHVDFRKIDLKKKIETEVPIKIIGESEAVTQKEGVLLTLSDKLVVEALPEDIPQNFVIDISILKDIGQEIKVKDIKITEKFEIKDDAEKVIVSVTAHKEESITPETETEAPEITTEAPPKEGEEAEGKTAEETETKAKESKGEKVDTSKEKEGEDKKDKKDEKKEKKQDQEVKK